ncbi:alpha/beta hydrolase [Streptomyces albireticuli]|uniref:alpha/beta hydrolase n=1 Tax=Streptomyces albireticuli TaxID=1940 RepID=UPI000D1A1247|nr:alpha/beta hydrolase [Streptomyces albireticuli]MCD9195041.1 S9 family peptidase [Streptomyces albireticuli]
MFHGELGDGGRAGATGVGRRAVAKAAVAGAALVVTGGTGSAAARARVMGGVVPRLPAPTGPYPLGVAALHLVDRGRRDPWAPAIAVRELMVTVFYPARDVRGRPVAPRMTADAAATFAVLDPAVHPGLPTSGVDWAAASTHAHTDAPALPGRRPVLLYSPGGADPRTLGTGLAEELASRGRVVVTVDHPGDASEVDFPARTAWRKKVRTTVFEGDPRKDPGLFRTAIGARVADLRFVLDRLGVLAAGGNPDAAGRPLPDGLGRALDLRRVGAYGHSAGGTAVAQALYEDRRIGAAVCMEGYLDHPPQAPGREGELFPVARYGVDRPLLLLGTDGFADQEALERSWSAAAAHPGRHVRRRRIEGAGHWVFTDYGPVVARLHEAGLMTREDRVRMVGAMGAAESVPLVRGLVGSFFDRWAA